MSANLPPNCIFGRRLLIRILYNHLLIKQNCIQRILIYQEANIFAKATVYTIERDSFKQIMGIIQHKIENTYVSKQKQTKKYTIMNRRK